MPRPPFPFPALAAHASRAPLGRGREVGMACLMAARLASEMLPPPLLDAAERAARGARLRVWLASLMVPRRMREPLARLCEAAAHSEGALFARSAGEVAVAVRAVAAAGAAYLDAPSRDEMERLARRLEASGDASA